MLDHGGDDVLLRRGVRQDGAENGKVVGLGATASKHQFLRLAAEQSGHFPARHLQSLLSDLAILMDAGGIAWYFK